LAQLPHCAAILCLLPGIHQRKFRISWRMSLTGE
jgi:hypothetical protein